MELLVGILAAWGLIMLLWTLLGAAFLPLSRRDDTKLTVLLRASGKDHWSLHYVRGLLWLRNAGLIWWDIVVVAEDENSQLSGAMEVIMAKNSHVELIGCSDLKEWMEANYVSECGTDVDSGDCGSSPV